MSREVNVLRMRKGIVPFALVAGVLAGGCGSGTSPGVSSTGPTAVGTSLPFLFTVRGTNLKGTVTLTRVVDPATSNLPAPAGSRYVGMAFTIEDTSNSSLLVDLAAMTVVVDSSGSSYSPNFTPLTDCPTPTAGLLEVAPGTTGSDCVAFSIPTATTLDRVVVGSSGKTPGTWTVAGETPTASTPPTTTAGTTTNPGTHVITYTVTGTASTVNLIWIAAGTNGSSTDTANQYPLGSGWSKTYTFAFPYLFVSVSAIVTGQQGGTVTCTIKDGPTAISNNSASGAGAQAQCQVNLKQN